MFGERLKAKRLDKKLSQRELASKVGVTHAYISQVERGQKTPTFETTLKLADALGISFIDLYDNKLQLDQNWVIFNKQLEEKNITPEEAMKYINIALRIKDDLE